MERMGPSPRGVSRVGDSGGPFSGTAVQTPEAAWEDKGVKMLTQKMGMLLSSAGDAERMLTIDQSGSGNCVRIGTLLFPLCVTPEENRLGYYVGRTGQPYIYSPNPVTPGLNLPMFYEIYFTNLKREKSRIDNTSAVTVDYLDNSLVRSYINDRDRRRDGLSSTTPFFEYEEGKHPMEESDWDLMLHHRVVEAASFLQCSITAACAGDTWKAIFHSWDAFTLMWEMHRMISEHRMGWFYRDPELMRSGSDSRNLPKKLRGENIFRAGPATPHSPIPAFQTGVHPGGRDRPWGTVWTQSPSPLASQDPLGTGGRVESSLPQPQLSTGMVYIPVPASTLAGTVYYHQPSGRGQLRPRGQYGGTRRGVRGRYNAPPVGSKPPPPP
jgi:hypothetical protein